MKSNRGRIKMQPIGRFLKSITLAYIGVMAILSLPPLGILHNKAQSYMNLYLNPLMLNQNWSMFAHPSGANGTVSAQVHYRDGSVRIWRMPDLGQMDYFHRFTLGRYNKWLEGSYLPGNIGRQFLTDAVQHIKNEMDIIPENPVTRVTLYRHLTAPESFGKIEMAKGPIKYTSREEMAIDLNFDEKQ